ncbi:Calponin homology (CH) domain [Popillia japonica]
MALRTSGVPRREPCAKCGNPVYIAERLTVGKSLYHRTCFRCARCNSQLTLANYYETETPNQFCCETCPDEEAAPPSSAAPLTSVKDIKTDEKSMLSRSLSDEEKSAGLKNLSDRLQMAHDEYSAQFETALEDSLTKTHEYSKARSQFLSANLVDETSDSETPPELPKTKPPDIVIESKVTPSNRRNATKDISGVSVYQTPYSPKLGQRTHDISRISATSASEKQKTNDSFKAPSIGVVNQSSISTTNLKKNVKKDEVTKDKSPINDVRSNTVTPSLVKNRMKLFETTTTTQEKDFMREELNLKRPLVDAAVVSPEKRISRDSPKSSPISPTRKSLADTSKQSPKEIAQTQAKSLNFLLQKQIALKEGKISPKSIIDQAKTEAATSANESKPQKPKSLENLAAKPKVNIPKSTTSEDLAKSLLISPTRRSIEENKMKFATKEESKPKLFVLDSKLIRKPMAEKISPEKEKRLSADVPPSLGSPYRLKKQQSMEETLINKTEPSTRINFSKNWKDGRKENVYQSPNRHKSVDARIGSSPSINDTTTKPRTFKDYTSPYRKHSLESPLRTGFGLIERVESPRQSGLDKSKLRSGLYTSDTELNNILNRKNADKSNLLTSKSTGCLPMRSIENLYRSNSEENIRFRNELRMKSDTNIDQQSKANNFQKLYGARSHMSVKFCEVIVVDLTEDSSSEGIKKDVITISDDSVIEISDTSSLNQTAASGKSEENKLEPTDYPEDLNPFGDDDDDPKLPVENRKVTPPKKTKASLNPFDDSEDEDDIEETKSPKPTAAVRKKIIIPMLDETHDGDTPEYLKRTVVQRVSINPFEEDDEEDESEDRREEEHITKPPPVSGPPKKVISAPRISLSPFWSDVDEDEPEDDEDERKPKPVPKPRKFRNAAGSLATPEPKPRTSNLSNLSISALTFGSNSSLSSGQSGGQSVRKKKPAPRPPIHVAAETKNESANESSLTSSPSTSVSHSPRLPTKYRKSKKAPLPPSSTPQVRDSIHPTPEISDISPISIQPHPATELEQPEDGSLSTTQEEWSSDKYEKDKANENRRSQTFNNSNLTSPQSNNNNAYQDYIPNKSTYGKWKRKKGPAPSRPVPQRRMIKALPVSEFRKELDLIELQKQGLEKQGVRLEQIIRDRCEGPEQDQNIDCDDDSVPIDVEDLILQLFEVVNEKNELSRREAELMYLQRQQRLEEEHADTEYQIRCLMMQPEVNKTDSDKAKEEELIQRLVEIVERRNEIIECLEMDRLREAEEDDSISTSLNSYASRRDEQTAGNIAQNLEVQPTEEIATKKEKSKKSKKEKKKKKSDKLDADKDVDESESSITSSNKEKKKKKFALF